MAIVKVSVMTNISYTGLISRVFPHFQTENRTEMMDKPNRWDSVNQNVELV